MSDGPAIRFAEASYAQSVYARDGIRKVRKTDGDTDESLPDVVLRWDRA